MILRSKNLNKIILYIRDTELAGPGAVFMVGELGAMYVEMLDGHDIVWSTHVSQFAEFLLARVPGLLNRLSSNKLSVFLILLFKITFKTPRIFLKHW